MLLTATWFFQNFNSIVYSFELFISSIFTLSWFVFQHNTCSFLNDFYLPRSPLTTIWNCQLYIICSWNFVALTSEPSVDILSNLNLNINENSYYLSDLMHVLSGRKSRIEWNESNVNWSVLDLRSSISSPPTKSSISSLQLCLVNILTVFLILTPAWRDNERRVLGLQGRIPGSGGNEVAMKPSYGDSPNKVGREQLAQEVLAFGDTLYFNPPEENRYGFNSINHLPKHFK